MSQDTLVQKFGEALLRSKQEVKPKISASKANVDASNNKSNEANIKGIEAARKRISDAIKKIKSFKSNPLRAMTDISAEIALAFQYGLSEELNELEKSLEDVKKAQEEALAKNNIISPDFNREKFKDNLAKDPIAAAEYYFTRKDIADALAVSNKISNGEQVSENELKSLIETRTSALNILDENKLSKAVGVKNAELEEKFVNAKTKVEKETIQAELTRGTKVLEDLGRTAIGRQVINVHREDAERENQGKKTNDDELYIKKGHFIVRDIKKTEALIKKDIEEGLAAVGILHGHGKEHLIKSTVRTGNIDELKNAINVIKSKNKEAAKEEIKQEQVPIFPII